MDEHSCKENRTKICECAEIHNHRREVKPNSQEMKELVCSWDQRNTKFFGGKSLGVHGVHYKDVSING